jgi:hypothetical protein
MTISIDVENLLLGLAWMGEASTNQIQRLWMQDYAYSTVCTYLRRLLADQLVTRRRWAVPRIKKGDRRAGTIKAPCQQPVLWGLGEQGHKLIADHEAFPPKLLNPRHRTLLDHDTQTYELITRIVELGRPAKLSGLYIEREVRLDPPHPRPIMDALILVRTGGAYDRTNAVPWTKDPYVCGEKRRRYAIENDRGSEALSILAGKARAYKAAGTNNWLTVYGRPFPIPLILVPGEARLRGIMEVWKGAWPEGKWLITTDAWLQQDRWMMYFKGDTRERRLFAPEPTGEADDGERETR